MCKKLMVWQRFTRQISDVSRFILATRPTLTVMELLLSCFSRFRSQYPRRQYQSFNDSTDFSLVHSKFRIKNNSNSKFTMMLPPAENHKRKLMVVADQATAPERMASPDSVLRSDTASEKYTRNQYYFSPWAKKGRRTRRRTSSRFVMILCMMLMLMTVDQKHRTATSFAIGRGSPENIPAKLLLDATSTSSWQDYQNQNPLQRSFERDGGILYKTSVLTPDELMTIREEVTKLMVKDETTSSVARKRQGAVLLNDSETVRILREGSILTNVVSKVMAGTTSYILSSDIPVELRIYEKEGAGMDWHVDDVLSDPPQLEVVLTLENTSDCQTMWKLADNVQEVVETNVNSAILLQAGGIPHCVSSLKRGRRAILKCAYVEEGAVFRKNEMVTQFSSTSKARKKGKKR
jgi:hypothetical protein